MPARTKISVSFLIGQAGSGLERIEDESVVDDLASAGWGVVLPPGGAAERLDALDPLIKARTAQARDLFKVLRVKPNESAEDFLKRHGAPTVGLVDQEKVPYYLLLLARPDELDFAFQRRLDEQHAVGRLCLDWPDAHAAYARAVLANDAGTSPRAEGCGFFATAYDPASNRALNGFIGPLRQLAPESRPSTGADATRAALAKLLGAGGPELLIAAAHGDNGAADPRHLGALLCGAGDQPFTADDLDGLDVAGLLFFCFSCFGAGKSSGDLAPLPQRLLSRGALAVAAFLDPLLSAVLAGPQNPFNPPEPQAARAMLRRLQRGKRIGFALEPLNERALHMLAGAAQHLDATQAPRRDAGQSLHKLVLFGDPAVRLAPRPVTAR